MLVQQERANGSHASHCQWSERQQVDQQQKAHNHRLLHAAMIVCLLLLVYLLALGPLAVAGVGAVCALLLYEHSLVKSNDLSRVNAAFFTMNGWVSVLF